ncbi:MAG: hypothetical protein H6861_07430 [Rhodospirillales bacterium]|nr:hypothetical protein [Rhodospirillales bacterium]
MADQFENPREQSFENIYSDMYEVAIEHGLTPEKASEFSERVREVYHQLSQSTETETCPSVLSVAFRRAVDVDAGNPEFTVEGYGVDKDGYFFREELDNPEAAAVHKKALADYRGTTPEKLGGSFQNYVFTPTLIGCGRDAP